MWYLGGSSSVSRQNLFFALQTDGLTSTRLVAEKEGLCPCHGCDLWNVTRNLKGCHGAPSENLRSRGMSRGWKVERSISRLFGSSFFHPQASYLEVSVSAIWSDTWGLLIFAVSRPSSFIGLRRWKSRFVRSSGLAFLRFFSLLPRRLRFCDGGWMLSD